MATIAKAVEGYIAPGQIVVSWASAFGNADDGAPARLYNISRLQVQVTGTAASATTVIEGGVDGVNYETLHDEDGTDLSFTSGSIPRVENVRECNMPFIRPRTSGGSGTAITVQLVAQQNMI